MANTRSKASSSGSQDDADSPQITDCEIRTIIKYEDSCWRKLPEVFYVNGGIWQSQLKVPFYPVALATNPDGVRYLSDARLDEVVPLWKGYLSLRRPRLLSKSQDKWKSGWNDWLKKEKAKLKGLGLSWPSTHVPHLIQDMGDPKAPTEGLKDSNDEHKGSTDGRGTKRAYPDEDIRHNVPNKRSTRLLRRSNGLRDSETSDPSIHNDEEMVLSQSEASSS